jgi:serine/threonine protein kinase
VATLALRALSDAHRQGVLHRDIKPENLMVVGVLGAPGGNLVLLDFGLAKFYETYSDILSSKARNRTSVAGTPLYMAPEVAAGNSPSCQSDIYSLGLVLHELISGAKPQFRERPKFPLLGVSDRLNHIVFRAVCDLPSQRWSSAQEMLSALLSTAEIQTSAISVQTPNITTEWTFPTNPVPRFGTIAFLVGTLGIIGFLIVGHGMHWATGDSTWIRSNNDLVPSYSKRPLRLTEGNSLVYFDLEGRELRRFSFEDHVDVAYEKLTRIVERHLPHGASTELRVRREFEILNRWDCSPRDGVISRHEYRE